MTCAFRLCRPAQNGSCEVGIPHFSFKFLHKMALVQCPCSFQTRRLKTTHLRQKNLPKDLLEGASAKILFRDLAWRSCSEILPRDPLQTSCQQSSYRDLVQGSCQETSYGDLVQRPGEESSQRAAILLRDLS